MGKIIFLLSHHGGYKLQCILAGDVSKWGCIYVFSHPLLTLCCLGNLVCILKKTAAFFLKAAMCKNKKKQKPNGTCSE